MKKILYTVAILAISSTIIYIIISNSQILNLPKKNESYIINAQGLLTVNIDDYLVSNDEEWELIKNNNKVEFSLVEKQVVTDSSNILTHLLITLNNKTNDIYFELFKDEERAVLYNGKGILYLDEIPDIAKLSTLDLISQLTHFKANSNYFTRMTRLEKQTDFENVKLNIGKIFIDNLSIKSINSWRSSNEGYIEVSTTKESAFNSEPINFEIAANYQIKDTNEKGIRFPDTNFVYSDLESFIVDVLLKR